MLIRDTVLNFFGPCVATMSAVPSQLLPMKMTFCLGSFGPVSDGLGVFAAASGGGSLSGGTQGGRMPACASLAPDPRAMSTVASVTLATASSVTIRAAPTFALARPISAQGTATSDAPGPPLTGATLRRRDL